MHICCYLTFHRADLHDTSLRQTLARHYHIFSIYAPVLQQGKILTMTNKMEESSDLK